MIKWPPQIQRDQENRRPPARNTPPTSVGSYSSGKSDAPLKQTMKTKTHQQKHLGFSFFTDPKAKAWVARLLKSDDLLPLIAASLGVGDAKGIARLKALNKADADSFKERFATATTPNQECLPEALAAAEIVAALRGHPCESLPPKAAAWVATHRDITNEWLTALALPAARSVTKNMRAVCESEKAWKEWTPVFDDVMARLRKRPKK